MADQISRAAASVQTARDNRMALDRAKSLLHTVSIMPDAVSPVDVAKAALKELRKIKVKAEAPPRRPVNAGQMSERQLQILWLSAQGLTKREIAERLFLSENTIRSHTLRIFRVLGAANTAHAVSKCFESGEFPRA